MDFQAFDTKKMEDYKSEVKERWGGTREYQEYEQKQEKAGDSAEAGRRMMNIFAELGALRQLSPSDRSVQEKSLRCRTLLQIITIPVLTKFLVSWEKCMWTTSALSAISTKPAAKEQPSL